MRFDVFFSLCQNVVDGYLPSEREMFENFFEEIEYADALPYETAWVAESHLSSEVQKSHKKPVIPHFEGEVGINTDICQLAHKIFSKTKRIEVGSAIRNILCNGGPLAHAESIRSFLSLHGLNTGETRRLHLGFASGRFDYSNKPYGIFPRNAMEEEIWDLIKPKIFLEAVEIFCRAMRGDTFSSKEIPLKKISKDGKEISIEAQWVFDEMKIIPHESPLNLLSLIIGSHDANAQILANKFLPCKVFNLSITPVKTIEETHERMKQCYHPEGGPWKRDYLPRTVLVFIDENSSLAKKRAQKALEVYWKAMEGTIRPERIKQAIDNALCGSPEEIREQLYKNYHSEDRLMLWFDFNCHDSSLVKKCMKLFAEEVISKL